MACHMNNSMHQAALAIPLDERSRQLRQIAIKTLESGKRAHLGSAMSIMEIIRVLYDNFLKIDPANPEDPERDIFILSKGHAGAAVYATLANFGFFSKEILVLTE